MEKKKLKPIYLLPNAITTFSLACGLFIIFKMTMLGIGTVDEHVLLLAAGILVIASIADVLDGAVARAVHAESRFGGIFDSLADAITFGVSPTVVVLKTLSIEPGTELSFWITTAAMVYAICGVLRLVRYSANSEVAVAIAPNAFTGLPIPAAAAGVVSANLFLRSVGCSNHQAWCTEIHVITMAILMLTLGYLMISRWKFPSIKTFRVRVISFKRVFIFVLGVVLLFYGFIYHFPTVFFVLSWTYIIAGLALSVARVVAGRKSKTLEEFEPANDDLELEE